MTMTTLLLCAALGQATAQLQKPEQKIDRIQQQIETIKEAEKKKQEPKKSGKPKAKKGEKPKAKEKPKEGPKK